MSLDGIFAKQLNITSNESEYFKLESLDNFNWNLVPNFTTPVYVSTPLYLKNNITVIRLLEKKLGGILLDLLHKI